VRLRAVAGPLLAVMLLVGCATPAQPSPAVDPEPPASVAVVPSATVAPTPAATPVPTPSPAPTPIPTIEPAGIEAFTNLENGRWEIISSDDNLGGRTEVSVLAPMTEYVEVFIHCAGNGRLDVQIGATPPATDASEPAATPYDMAAASLECPQTNGESITLAAPAGWFASPNAAPSDPSIRYQVIVGTIVD